MKTLILVRHGKSSWKYDLPDHLRPHKKRAVRDADLVTGAFKNQFKEPVTAWSSHAVRALETAKMFKEELEIDEKDFQVKRELYTFEPSILLKTLRSCNDDVDRLMIFGHNPAITAVANSLGDQNFDNIPTTGLCLIEFETDSWRTIKKGKTILYLFPKNLR